MAIKIDDNTMQVTKVEKAPAVVVINYDYDFLLAQRAKIIADANDYVAKRTVELQDVDDLIAQANALGIVSKIMSEPLE